MSDTKILARVKNPARNTSDSDTMMYHRGTRDGVAFTADYFESLAMQGRIFTASMGSVTTALTFVVSAANRPDAWVRVPTATAILPIRCNVILESAAGTVTEIDVRICQNDIGNGTSAAATAGPLSMRTDSPVSSLCTARQLASADTTAETNPISIYRRTYARADEAGIDWRGIEATRAMMGYPLLIGAATWEVFIAATSTQATGFVVMTWAEVPASDFT